MAFDRELRSAQRRGLTIVEMLVCLALIFMLWALLGPSICSQSREPARRLQCQNQLREIGLALAQFHEVHGHFPPAMGDAGLNIADGADVDRMNGLVWLLPYLKQQKLWEQISRPGEFDGKSFPAMGPPPWDVSYPPWREQVDVFACPSYLGEWGPLGMTNYAFCIGDMARQIHEPTVARGAFACRRTTKLGDIADGQSHTIAMAEIGSDPFVINQPPEILENPRLCLVHETPTGRRRGMPWADGAAGCNLVNTILRPNSPSCAVGGAEEVDGIYSAGSDHPRGANVLMADGAVKFIPNDIDAGYTTTPTPTVEQMARNDFPSPYGVWGALGTARGGEQPPQWD